MKYPAVIHQASIFEDSAPFLMNQVYGLDGAFVTQSSLSGITFTVKDITGVSALDAATDGTVISSGSLTVSTVIFDTLETGAEWTKDDIGYNFGWQTLRTYFPNGPKVYRVEVLMTPVSGEAFWGCVWDIKTKKVYAS